MKLKWWNVNIWIQNIYDRGHKYDRGHTLGRRMLSVLEQTRVWRGRNIEAGPAARTGKSYNLHSAQGASFNS